MSQNEKIEVIRNGVADGFVKKKYDILNRNVTSTKIIDSMYHKVDGKAPDKEEIKSFYRTREKRISSFLKARGFPYRGMEKVLISSKNGKSKTIVVFCFDGGDETRQSIFEYYNSDERQDFNVNAKKILAEFSNITSMISNF